MRWWRDILWVKLRTANDRRLFDASVYTKLNNGRQNDG